VTAARVIVGTWPNGQTMAATQRDLCNLHEWLDDRFGQAFDIDPAVFGSAVDASVVQAETEHSFWHGCIRIELKPLGEVGS